MNFVREFQVFFNWAFLKTCSESSIRKTFPLMFCLYSSVGECLLFLPIYLHPFCFPMLSKSQHAQFWRHHTWPAMFLPSFLEPGCCSSNIISILLQLLCNPPPPHHYLDLQHVQGDLTESFHQPPAGITPPPPVARGSRSISYLQDASHRWSLIATIFSVANLSEHCCTPVNLSLFYMCRGRTKTNKHLSLNWKRTEEFIDMFRANSLMEIWHMHVWRWCRHRDTQKHTSSGHTRLFK